MARRPTTWLALLFYGVVVVAFTWPLAPRAATDIAATYGRFHVDTIHTAYIVAHASNTLAHAPTSFFDAGMYVPERRTLFYSTASLGLLPYFAPTFLATGNPALALNLAFLACLALTAWTIDLVVRRWTADRLAATGAGLVYLFSGTTTWGFPSAAPYFAVLQYVPLLVYAAATPSSRLAAPLPMAVLIALQCLVEPLYVAPVVGAPLLAITAWRLARPSSRAAGLRLLAALVLAGIALVPLYAGYAEVVMGNPHLSDQSVWSRRDGSGASGGPGASLLFSAIAYPLGWWYAFSLPLVALAVVVAGIILVLRGRIAPDTRVGWAHAALWTAIAWWLPFLGSSRPELRGFWRAGLVDLVTLSLLSGLSIAACATALASRVGHRARLAFGVALLAALFVAPNGSVSSGAMAKIGRFPTQPAPESASPVIDVLRRGHGPVLEIPAGRGPMNVPALYRAIFHRRPLLNGYGSYFPASLPGRLKIIARLPAPMAVALLRAGTGLATIVVRTNELTPPARASWDDAWRHPERRTDLRPVLEHDGIYVFDVVL